MRTMPLAKAAPLAGAAVALTLTLALSACDEKKAPAPPAEPSSKAATSAAPSAAPSAAKALASSTIDPSKLKAFAALPASFESKDNPSSEPKVLLGRMLYFDARLSKGQTVACASCHDLAKFGVDGHAVSEGHKGQKGGRNAPTVLNAAGHFVQFWDGRAADVEAQAKGPIFNPIEMAMPDEKRLLDTLKSMPDYEEAFKKAFPDAKPPVVTVDNVARAIAAFERKLVTPARWDKFLAGATDALTAEEKAGFNTFVDTGCAGCHTGALLGGGMYQKAGLVQPWPSTTDPGRFNVTKQESDRMFFKVPSLRNIAKTGPYFHDGGTATLEEAVRTMAKHQLGKTLTDDEVKGIVAWLGTLTGDVPAALATAPKLPASTAKTPKADPN